MTIITKITQSKVISNLDTYQHTTLNAGMYTMTMTINERPVSGITVTFLRNGSTVASTPAPTAPGLVVTTTGAGSGPLTTPSQSNIGQEVVQLSLTMNCAIGDVLQAVVASSTSHDAKPNDFKGILNIRQGTI